MMNGRSMNLENAANEWHEALDDDYVGRLENGQDTEAEKKRRARAQIEAMREKKMLDDMLYDVFDDPLC